MRILVTNDDGIDSKGLKALVEAAQKRGHTVLVSAPNAQQSAASQRITLTAPLMVHERTVCGSECAFAVEGTPADCVRLAPQLMDGPIDLCLSGINDGENAGCAAYYSGTVSAAREAAMHYIPAFAVSIMAGADDEMRQNIARISLDIAEKCDLSKFPRMGVLNINAPALPPRDLKPMMTCPLSAAYYTDHYEKRVNPFGKTYYWLNGDLPMEEPEEGSDYYYLRHGHTTCTMLTCMKDENAIVSELLQDFPG